MVIRCSEPQCRTSSNRIISLIKVLLSNLLFFCKVLHTCDVSPCLPNVVQAPFPIPPLPFCIYLFIFHFIFSCSCSSQRGASALLLSRMFRQSVCRGGKMERQHSSETLAPRIIMQRRGWGGAAGGAGRLTDRRRLS